MLYYKELFVIPGRDYQVRILEGQPRGSRVKSQGFGVKSPSLFFQGAYYISFPATQAEHEAYRRSTETQGRAVREVWNEIFYPAEPGEDNSYWKHKMLPNRHQKKQKAIWKYLENLEGRA